MIIIYYFLLPSSYLFSYFLLQRSIPTSNFFVILVFITEYQLTLNPYPIYSLVPFRIHLPVIKSCIQNKVNILTASYLTQEMKEFQQQALDANITMFNEIGFDPGIDHMLAMRCFDEVHDKGGKVSSNFAHA